MKKYLFVLLLCAQGLFAQGLFEVKTTHEKLGINEMLRVDFIMHDDGEKFAAPSFDGFKVVEGPRRNQFENYQNGKRMYNLTYSYLLQPLVKGQHTIGGASVEFTGDKFTTKPFTVTVTDAVKHPGKVPTLDIAPVQTPDTEDDTD